MAWKRQYGQSYRRARAALLAGHPMCHWCGVNPATEADHVPPVSEVGPHLHLVPSCAACNKGWRQARTPFVSAPSRQWV